MITTADSSVWGAHAARVLVLAASRKQSLDPIRIHTLLTTPDDTDSSVWGAHAARVLVLAASPKQSLDLIRSPTLLTTADEADSPDRGPRCRRGYLAWRFQRLAFAHFSLVNRADSLCQFQVD